MKRILSTLLALVLLLGLCSGALGEDGAQAGGATLLCELPKMDISWIRNTDLLYIRGDRGCSVAGLDGKPMTEELYSFQLSGENGLIITHKNEEGINVWGALDETGAEVVPFQYGDIKVPGEHWAVGIVLTPTTSDDYDYYGSGSSENCVIETVDIYSLSSPGTKLTLTRDQYANSAVRGELLNVQDRTTGVVTSYDADLNAKYTDLYGVYSTDHAGAHDYSVDGKYGLKDDEGNVILEPSFDMTFSFEGDFMRVSSGGLMGLVDLAGQLRVPTEYDDILKGYEGAFDADDYENYGYFCVVKDGKLGYIGPDGALSCAPKYDAEQMKNYGVSAAGAIDDTAIILAADGVETELTEADYSDCQVVANSCGMFYAVENDEGLRGAIDLHGNEVLPCEFKELTFSGSGHYALGRRQYSENYEIYELADPTLGA